MSNYITRKYHKKQMDKKDREIRGLHSSVSYERQQREKAEASLEEAQNELKRVSGLLRDCDNERMHIVHKLNEVSDQMDDWGTTIPKSIGDEHRMEVSIERQYGRVEGDLKAILNIAKKNNIPMTATEMLHRQPYEFKFNV